MRTKALLSNKKQLTSCQQAKTDKAEYTEGLICTVTVTEFHSLTELFSEELCSVVGLSEKVSFQLRSELPATVVW